jgi:hypothetical protein
VLALSREAKIAILKLGADSLREAGVLWLTFGLLEGIMRTPNTPWGNWWFPTTVLVGVVFIATGAIVAVGLEGGKSR